MLSGSDRLTDADDLERRLGAPVYDAYGSTETGTVCVASPDERRRFAGAVGRPLAGVRIRELDGGLEIRSPMLGRGTFRGDRGRIRDGIVIYTGKLGSLKRFKDDVKEVTTGQDCGLNIESFNDIRVGDIVEGYEQVEVKRK